MVWSYFIRLDTVNTFFRKNTIVTKNRVFEPKRAFTRLLPGTPRMVRPAWQKRIGRIGEPSPAKTNRRRSSMPPPPNAHARQSCPTNLPNDLDHRSRSPASHATAWPLHASTCRRTEADSDPVPYLPDAGPGPCVLVFPPQRAEPAREEHANARIRKAGRSLGGFAAKVLD